LKELKKKIVLSLHFWFSFLIFFPSILIWVSFCSQGGSLRVNSIFLRPCMFDMDMDHLERMCDRRTFKNLESSESQILEEFDISLSHWLRALGFTSSISIDSFFERLSLNIVIKKRKKKEKKKKRKFKSQYYSYVVVIMLYA
jgi:hypothetical protein